MFTTPEPYIICAKCSKKFGHFDKSNGLKLCTWCAGNAYKKGCGSYVPCKKCKPPNINWYYQDELPNSKKQCEMHQMEEYDQLEANHMDMSILFD
jgi:hypothetical protein